MAPRDYARLSWKWHRDKVLRAVNRQAPGTLQLWPVLIGMSKEQSHVVDNPRGVIETSWDDLADEAMLPADQVQRIVELLAGDAEMVEVDAGRLDIVHVALLRFGDWQVPRGSKAEQQQIRRDAEAASREKTAERGVGVGSQSVSFTETETERSPQGVPPLSPPPAVDGPDPVRQVFDYWCRVERETGGMGSAPSANPPKLTKDRRTKIQARLRDGFDVADLKRAIAFYAKDPHHRGDNDRGTRFTDLTTTFKNGSKVEQGVAGYHRRHNGGDDNGGGTSLDDRGSVF